MAAICSTFAETPMMDEAATVGGVPREDFCKALGASSSAESVGKPEEMRNAIVWLSADTASCVTGSAPVVDGGWICGYPPFPLRCCSRENVDQLIGWPNARGQSRTSVIRDKFKKGEGRVQDRLRKESALVDT